TRLNFFVCYDAVTALTASACAFRFLRQPNRPRPPRPVAKSGRADGRGVTTSGARPQKFDLVPGLIEIALFKLIKPATGCVPPGKHPQGNIPRLMLVGLDWHASFGASSHPESKGPGEVAVLVGPRLCCF